MIPNVLKLILLVISIASQVLLSAYAQNSSQCGSIQNADQRAMCRALADRNSGQCGSINNDDLRAMCRAQVNRNPGQCGAINNNDMRATCRALTGG